MTLSAQEGMARAMSEGDLQASIEQAARTLGFLAYHTRDSRRSAAGFPDLVLVKGGVLILAELKRQDAKPTGDQLAWLRALGLVESRAASANAAGVVRVRLWRPLDWLRGKILWELQQV